jgi:hypothetical protein
MAMRKGDRLSYFLPEGSNCHVEIPRNQWTENCSQENDHRLPGQSVYHEHILHQNKNKCNSPENDRQVLRYNLFILLWADKEKKDKPQRNNKGKVGKRADWSQMKSFWEMVKRSATPTKIRSSTTCISVKGYNFIVKTPGSYRFSHFDSYNVIFFIVI